MSCETLDNAEYEPSDPSSVVSSAFFEGLEKKRTEIWEIESDKLNF